MTRYPARALFPVSIVAGLLLACAHGPAAGGVQPDAVQPQIPPTSLEQLLAGRVAGVTVSAAPGGGISVQIGGPKSFMLSGEPLFVVDGVPVEAGPNGTLSWLNPRDIESIVVLKDATTAAIYGVRGANGVIVIKTIGAR